MALPPGPRSCSSPSTGALSLHVSLVCEGASQCLSFSSDAQPLGLAPSEPLTNGCTFKGTPGPDPDAARGHGCKNGAEQPALRASGVLACHPGPRHSTLSPREGHPPQGRAESVLSMPFQAPATSGSARPGRIGQRKYPVLR